MTTYEWIGLIVVLLTGFWTLHKELTAIRVVICNRVTYEDCSHKRERCPLEERIKRLEDRQ